MDAIKALADPGLREAARDKLAAHNTVREVGAVALTPYAREHGRPNTGAYAI